MTEPLLTQAGAYEHVDAEDYHRNLHLLPAPSLSSSGAKLLLRKSPFHFWFDSPMNPARPPEPDKPHFNVGKAAHDFLLLSERWPDHYHVLPEGYSAAKSKAMADDIAAAEFAREQGKTVLRSQDAETVRQVAAAIRRNELATAALTAGIPEMTLVWQDAETSVWLRARPDFLPHSVRMEGRDIIVTDLKFMAPTNADPEGFQRAIYNNGYHQSAAFYADGIKAIFGRYPTNWLHVVVEKEAPHCVALYELPQEDIERGRWLNREAIQTFARCLETGRWPGFADEPRQVGLPGWARNRIENPETHEAAWSAAA